ncbi:hypothetical protein [Paraliomyxa miuraensis]|uniref:hypothetical protein n=1 Tax=Paraliomyxa miuraensis TaxID=376150 RepID=UPI00224F8FC4|nr:hypothetical protein [Paraliomyxa miuraensis]MCX4239939.1 hypothetical protein [Paraliomyxa miuraensis]
MMRTILSVAVAASVVMPLPAVAARGATTTVVEPYLKVAPKVEELQAMHGQAQEKVQLYNGTHDPAHLAEARELLARWLVEHRALYGDTPEAASVRAPIEQQLGQIDAELTRVRPAVAPQPPPAELQPAAAPAPAEPPPPAMREDQAEDLRSGRALVAGGSSMFSVGAVTLLAVSLPLWALRNQALERASRETFYVDEQRLIDRARRRQTGGIVTLAAGSALVLGGIAMMAVGGARRARVRRELALVPTLAPGHAGASMTMRF